jgi:hypothetical protein
MMLDRREVFAVLWHVIYGLVITAILMTLFALFCAAHARWRPEYAGLPADVRDWYERAELTPAAQRRFNFKSCCAHSDVVRTRFRVGKSDAGDRWEWLDNGTWREVPADIIHFDEHAPDGQATLFVLPGTSQPTCFYPPDGGI